LDVGDVGQEPGQELERGEDVRSGRGALALVGAEGHLLFVGIVVQPLLGDGSAGGVARELHPPERVVLVLESLHTRWLERHPHPLDFALPACLGAEVPRAGMRRIVAQLRGHSALVNLLANGLPQNQGGEAAASLEGNAAPGSAAEVHSSHLSIDLQQGLQQFQRGYGDRFLLVSLLDHAAQAREPADFCRAQGIALAPAPTLLRPENRFNGTGHLNARGNRELGEFLDAALAGHARQP
jgi:hypothetical protein